MDPTLHDGAVCLLDRSYYNTHSMARGDVIAFRMDDAVLTKRVYGAPGETIDLIKFPDDNTYVLPELRLVRSLRRLSAARSAAGPKFSPYLTAVTIPPDKCFVVGDNAEISYDSRAFGLVDTREVIGKMVAPSTAEP